jgi:hypothetical protein
MEGAKHRRPPGRIDAPLRGSFQEDQLHILRHCRSQVTSRYGLSRPRKNPQLPAVNGQLDARHPPRLIAREVHRAHMATAAWLFVTFDTAGEVKNTLNSSLASR